MNQHHVIRDAEGKEALQSVEFGKIECEMGMYQIGEIDSKDSMTQNNMRVIEDVYLKVTVTKDTEDSASVSLFHEFGYHSI